MEDQSFVSKANVIRSLSMTRDCAFQRRTVSAIGILISLLVISISLYLWPGRTSLQIFEGEKFRYNLSSYKKQNINNQNTKISIRKQVFIALNALNAEQNHVSQVASAWARDFMKRTLSGGFHVITTSPLTSSTLPILLLKLTSDIQSIKDDFFFNALQQSVSDYQNKTRALWYLQISHNVYLNSCSFQHYLNDFANLHDPMKEEILKIKCDHKTGSCIILISRAAAKAISAFSHPSNLSSYFSNQFQNGKIHRSLMEKLVMTRLAN